MIPWLECEWMKPDWIGLGETQSSILFLRRHAKKVECESQKNMGTQAWGNWQNALLWLMLIWTRPTMRACAKVENLWSHNCKGKWSKMMQRWCQCKQKKTGGLCKTFAGKEWISSEAVFNDHFFVFNSRWHIWVCWSRLICGFWMWFPGIIRIVFWLVDETLSWCVVMTRMMYSDALMRKRSQRPMAPLPFWVSKRHPTFNCVWKDCMHLQTSGTLILLLELVHTTHIQVWFLCCGLAVSASLVGVRKSRIRVCKCSPNCQQSWL